MRPQVWCCGRTDEAWLLVDIVGWAVESETARQHAQEIDDLNRRGLIQTRVHKAPCGEWIAYALTSKGFDRLRDIGSPALFASAARAHGFYRVAAPEVK